MQWAMLIIIIAGLLFLARYYPKIGFGALGVLVAGAGLVIFLTSDYGTLVRSQVPAEDVLIENAVMVPAYGGSYRMNARIVNTNQDSEIKQVTISITMFDCQAEDDCQVIGQSEAREILRVPPGQARDMARTITLDAARPSGTVRWEYRVTSTQS